MGYELKSYQAFLTQAVRLCGFGYRFYRLSEYPIRKADRWLHTDAKIAAKYPILALSKYQRARRKAQGLVNASFCRFRHLALLQISQGRDDVGILAAERPQDVRKAPIRLAIHNLVFQIHLLDGHFTVSLAQDCFLDLLAYLREVAAKADLSELKREFAALDMEIPSWRGTNRQRRKMLEEIAKVAKASGRVRACDELRNLAS